MSKPDFLAIAEAAMAAAAPREDVIQRIAQREACELRESRLNDSGVRGAITDEDWDWIVQDRIPHETHALRSVRRWMDVRSGSAKPLTTIALVGLTGRGKTLAGSWLISRLGGRYVTAEDLRRLVVSTHWRETAALDRLLSTRCLVIDDLGGELDAATAAAAVLVAVNRRSGSGNAWTALTGNLPEVEFRDRYGERTIRRIEHRGAIIEVTGEDLRRKAGQ
jgi:DNA replication protein DnaC